jgi:hypothetical protein
MLYYWRFTANPFFLAISPLRLTTSIFFFQLNTCHHSPHVTSSLMRGWVCRLQLLLAFANAVILRSESRGTHDHILISHIRDSPTWGTRVLAKSKSNKKSKSKSNLLYDWRFTANQFVLASSPLRPTTRFFFFN